MLTHTHTSGQGKSLGFMNEKKQKIIDVNYDLLFNLNFTVTILQWHTTKVVSNLTSCHSIYILGNINKDLLMNICHEGKSLSQTKYLCALLLVLTYTYI